MRSIALPLVLVLAACTGRHDGAGKAPEASPTPSPVAVTVRPVESTRLERSIEFVGTMNAYAEAEVAAEIDGRLTSIARDLGDQVRSGEILATLDAAEISARLREAEAFLARRTNDARRAEKLRGQGVMSQQEYDAIESDLGVARARRDLLAIQVEHARVRAPFDGRIARRRAEVGGYVRTGTPLFTLVSDDPLRLRGEVPERFAADLAVGQEVRATVEAFPDEMIVGKLTRISPSSNTQSRALTVEALVPNRDGRLKAGFFSKAGILTRTDADALVVPAEALVSFAGITRVFVVDADGTARAREVTTGQRRGTFVEIASGVAAGERVATSGLGRLSEGTRVVIRESAPGADGPSASPAAGRTAATVLRHPEVPS